MPPDIEQAEEYTPQSPLEILEERVKRQDAEIRQLRDATRVLAQGIIALAERVTWWDRIRSWHA